MIQISTKIESVVPWINSHLLNVIKICSHVFELFCSQINTGNNSRKHSECADLHQDQKTSPHISLGLCVVMATVSTCSFMLLLVTGL